MKKLFRWFAALLGATVLLGAVLATQVVFFRPFVIRIFHGKVFLQRLLEDPELLTQPGFAGATGGKVYCQ